MSNIYNLDDYRKSPFYVPFPDRGNAEYQRLRTDACYIVDRLRELEDEASALSAMLEHGASDPSYDVWEGDLDSFLHALDYSRNMCLEQIQLVIRQASQNALVMGFVMETLSAKGEQYRLLNFMPPDLQIGGATG